MESRIDYAKAAPGVRTAMSGLEEYVHQTGLEPALLELVKLRASLINGCAYCADMHTKVARSLGETEQRLYTVSLWSETPFFSERERAALAWTEAVTRVSVEHVPDEVYECARKQFSEKELVDLTLAIVAINGWNRLAIAFRTVPGTFQIRRAASARSSGAQCGRQGRALSRRAATHMKYDFLVDTYDTERLKVVSVWSEFKDEDLAVRPRHGDPRGRSVHEQMVHQCVSEDLWFRNMLGIDVAAPPLPEQETRLAFMRRYAEDSGKRVTGLREKRDLLVGGRHAVL